MLAAKTSSAKSVELLLKNNADPNLLSSKKAGNQNALAFALRAGDEKTISLLCKATHHSQGLRSCVRILAESNMKVGADIKVILRKLIRENSKDLLLEEASIFGNSQMAYFILNESNKWTKASLEKALRNSILSDNVDCCKIVKEYCEKIGVDIKTIEHEYLIIKRGRPKIVELFNLENVELKISPKYKGTLDKFPKTSEFPYHTYPDMIIICLDLPFLLHSSENSKKLQKGIKPSILSSQFVWDMKRR